VSSTNLFTSPASFAEIKMNQKDLLFISLRRPDLDYQMKAREALIHAEDGIKKKDHLFTKQLLSEFIFLEKNKKFLNSTQEIQLVVLLLSEVFVKDDAYKFPFFMILFEPGKKQRQTLLLKLILTAIATQSGTVGFLLRIIVLNIS
jgi:Domain of unknown function (DUF4507)